MFNFHKCDPENAVAFVGRRPKIVPSCYGAFVAEVGFDGFAALPWEWWATLNCSPLVYYTA